jgi:hypothetical protein
MPASAVQRGGAISPLGGPEACARLAERGIIEEMILETKESFYDDNDEFFNTKLLRELAHEEIVNSPLIRRCMTGEFLAAQALSIGFWPFVSAFEKAIDARLGNGGLPREPLYQKFDKTTAKSQLIKVARTIRDLARSEIETLFAGAGEALREMQIEEKTHSAHWKKDAENLGIGDNALNCATTVGGINQLIASTYTGELTKFFATLAATEFIAEELAAVLAFNVRYTDHFTRKRAIWMEVHAAPHDGLSHLDIDIDLMRAYSQEEDTGESLQDLIIFGIRLFGTASRQIDSQFFPM